jgi:cation:H+ antiporter
VLIPAIDDFACLSGPIYAKIAPVHAVSALTAYLLSGAVVLRLAYRAVSRVWHTASWASLALYLLNAVVQFKRDK